MEELYRGSSEVMSQLLGNMDEGLEVTQLEDDEGLADLSASADEASQRPVVRLVDLMLSDGILSRASDIHIEPGEAGVTVRYRIDGVLRQVMNIPRSAGLRSSPASRSCRAWTSRTGCGPRTVEPEWR